MGYFPRSVWVATNDPRALRLQAEAERKKRLQAPRKGARFVIIGEKKCCAK